MSEKKLFVGRYNKLFIDDVEADIVDEASFEMSAVTFDATTRASGILKTEQQTRIEASVSAKMKVPESPAGTAYHQCFTAVTTLGTVKVRLLGAGGTGLEFWCCVSKFGEDQPGEDSTMLDVELKPTTPPDGEVGGLIATEPS